MKLIADEEILFESPNPQEIYCYSPSLTVLPSGRLAASFDLGGPGVASLPGPRSSHGDFGLSNQARVYLSDDYGGNWRHATSLPMRHARLFMAAGRLYLLGHNGAMNIAVSEDEGENWSRVHVLDDTAEWHQAPCAVHYEKGYIYLTMEQEIPNSTWPGVAPVMMRGRLTDDLTRRSSWTFSNPLRFPEKFQETSSIGSPFYPTAPLMPGQPDVRFCGDPGWLESHVVKIHDPEHNLYGTDILHVWMRAHTGLSNIAAIAQCRIAADGSLTLDCVKSPVGTPMIHVPCPGGHMKFHIVYDEVQKLYWLVSSQSTDSMTRPELLPADRYGLPDNERHRLAFYFSKNLFDWCFAGMVAIGGSARQSRHYAAMIIRGEDLLILSRSGNEMAKSAHNGNLITLHQVKNFRNLVY